MGEAGIILRLRFWYLIEVYWESMWHSGKESMGSTRCSKVSR